MAFPDGAIAIRARAPTESPLQGIGGLELPQHNLIDPALWVVARLPPLVGSTVAMTVYAALLAAVICWLAARLRFSVAANIGAAWLGVLLALPYVYPSLGFDFLWRMRRGSYSQAASRPTSSCPMGRSAELA